MMWQGPEVAIGRLHPVFAVRLARAVKEARASGLPEAGCFSAYRPPVFGIGGYRDKFRSNHAAGLACDISGIGAPGSPEAILWHQIAARNGVHMPYGPYNRAEYNHAQLVPERETTAALRETFTADGPADLFRMWAASHVAPDNIEAPTPLRLVALEPKSEPPRK